MVTAYFDRSFVMSVRVEKNGNVTTIILDRPEVRNAVDGPTAQALADAFRAFEADDTAWVGVFVGANRTFCAGADLKNLADESQRNRLDAAGDAPMGVSRLHLAKPVIAAVSGYAVAGGLELALWCDLRVVEEDAVMGVFCRRWGVPLIDGGTVRLPRLIGMSRALDMILTGRPISAQEALEFGLANRVVPTGEGRQAAEALAAQLCQFPQLCVKIDRQSVYNQWGLDLETAMAQEFAEGVVALPAEGYAGAVRFASGVGRHGLFESTQNEKN
jgi:enoyl-CoA hydratase